MTPLSRTIDFAFLPKVPVISLELTNHCNLKCPYCSNPTLMRPKSYIEWPLVEKIVDECAERKYNIGWLHGVGEPLLWDRLEETISLIKRKGAGDGSFATNGTLLRPSRIKRLLDAGLESIYVSIDTLDPQLYANTRGGKLEIIVRNIEDMIKIVPSSFRITVALMNHKDQTVTEQSIRQFYQTFGTHQNLQTNLVANQLFPSAPADYRVDASEKLRGCWSPRNYVFIALDGRVAICCMDQEVLHSLGSVTDRSIHDIWFDKKNQTTFRNVALGVFECPKVCTEKCVLMKPREEGMVAPVAVNAPFEDVMDFTEWALSNGQKGTAIEMLRGLWNRAPSNDLFARLKELEQNEFAFPSVAPP
jgi:MoaA/NifB/PqqE/SkfB family radical SAM enzyme